MLVVAGTIISAAVPSGNMNGKYSVSSGARMDVPFNDDYASKGNGVESCPFRDLTPLFTNCSLYVNL
jgi:hypothetical protein